MTTIKDEGKEWYCLQDMNADNIYNALCTELKFWTMIEVYRLIKHKIETLEDETRNYCEKKVNK